MDDIYPPQYEPLLLHDTASAILVNSGQSNIFGQSPGFQPSFSKQESGTVSAQPAQASSAFGIAQSTQISKVASTEKMSVFGQSSNISTGQTGSVFGATTQISTSSSAVDSTFTQVASNSEHSFKPPAYTTFKPILTGATKSDETSAPSFSMSGKNESKDQPLFGASTSSSTSGNLNLFSMSSDKKSKGEAGTPRPSFASANSSFTSFTEEPRREEGQKGVKRKEEYDRSPRRNDAAISGEASSDPHSEHLPIKRSSRLNRDLKGGANIYVRSLFDVVKSQMKTQRGREIKKGDNVSPQPKVTDANSPSKNQPTIRPLLGPSQTESVKTISAGLSSQVNFNKSQMTSVGHATPTRMVSFLGPNQQGSPRENSSGGPSELKSGRIRPLLEEGELLPEIEPPSSNLAASRGERSDGGEHLVPVSPSDLATFLIRNVPNNLNKKNIMEDHFKKYGKILRINCRVKQKMAIIQFNNHCLPSGNRITPMVLCLPMIDSEKRILRYRHTKRRCSDTDNDVDCCSVAVWSLESCHTDSSPATNDPEVPCDHDSEYESEAFLDPDSPEFQSTVDSLIEAVNHALKVDDDPNSAPDHTVSFTRTKPSHKVFASHPDFLDIVRRHRERPDKLFTGKKALGLKDPFSADLVIGRMLPYLGRTFDQEVVYHACEASVRITLDTLSRLGWLINLDKSSPVPARRISFLGMILDTSKGLVLLPRSRA
ncbi:unnamed protein product [Ranitomeya imitator]|uniref:RRM domain-containing protein n=1 Tax=Ranitomeya imitator TaxID=111125 RepID=A0ABN9LZJ6_9NEOB|nr:unnamed protein product [Ranitomeya imitator]